MCGEKISREVNILWYGCTVWFKMKLSEVCFWTVMMGKALESPLDSRIKPVHSKGNQPWIFTGRMDAEAEAPILWTPDAKSCLISKKPWWWERLKAEGERDDRGWDCWMGSLTQWTWVWASSARWWKTRKPGVLQSMLWRKVGHD